MRLSKVWAKIHSRTVGTENLRDLWTPEEAMVKLSNATNAGQRRQPVCVHHGPLLGPELLSDLHTVSVLDRTRVQIGTRGGFNVIAER